MGHPHPAAETSLSQELTLLRAAHSKQQMGAGVRRPSLGHLDGRSGWGAVKPASWLDFLLCPVLLPPLPSHRYVSLINALPVNLQLSVCFLRGHPAQNGR